MGVGRAPASAMSSSTPPPDSPRYLHSALLPISNPSSRHDARLGLLQALPGLNSSTLPPNWPLPFKPFSLEKVRPHWPGMNRMVQTEVARLETARGFQVTPRSVVACPTHAIRFSPDGHTAYLLGQKFVDQIPINDGSTLSAPYVHLVVVGRLTCFYHGAAVRPSLDLPDMSPSEKELLSAKVLRRFSSPDGTLHCVPIRLIEAARSPIINSRLCLQRCEAATNVEVNEFDGSLQIVQPSPHGILVGESEFSNIDPNDTSGSTVEVANDQLEDTVEVPQTSNPVPLSPGDYDLLAESPPRLARGSPGDQSSVPGSSKGPEPQTPNTAANAYARTPPTTPPSPSPASGPSMMLTLDSELESQDKPPVTPRRDLGKGAGHGTRPHAHDEGK
ncbi:hypothetical protein FRC01_008499 [Tulasnella sp. 417]|nr:hypothetical protein FRC01_008499 [Tulasnella sp. 417]